MDGKSFAKRFKQHCHTHRVEPSEDNLQTWDVKHNASRILKSFGTNQEIFQRAVRDRYREWLNNYFWIPTRGEDGKPGVGIGGIRSIEGLKVFTEDLTESQAEYVLDSISRRTHNDTIRLNEIFKDWKRAQEYLQEDARAAEMGLPADWRRKKKEVF